MPRNREAASEKRNQPARIRITILGYLRGLQPRKRSLHAKLNYVIADSDASICMARVYQCVCTKEDRLPSILSDFSPLLRPLVMDGRKTRIASSVFFNVPRNSIFSSRDSRDELFRIKLTEVSEIRDFRAV